MQGYGPDLTQKGGRGAARPGRVLAKFVSASGFLCVSGTALASTGAETAAYPLPESPPFAAPLPDTAESGADFAISWQDPLQSSGRGTDCADVARYLILSLPPESRLSGEGFLALGPGEAAPFGIDFAQDRLRAVIPLHLAHHAQGQLAVRPYVIGLAQIDWAHAHVPLAEGRNSVATILPGPGAALDIQPGVPKIVVQDPFDTTQPMATHISNDGAWRLETYAGYYRVFDTETGALVHDGDGVQPTFSPTGRFLHVFHAKADSAALATELAGLSPEEYFLFSDISVFDLVSGETALSERNDGWTGRGDFITALHWSPGDSFLAVLYEAQGQIGFQPMFVDRPYFRDEFGCGACSPQTEGIVVIDAENGAVTLGWAGNVTRIDLFTSLSGDGPDFFDRDGPAWLPNPLIVDDPAAELDRFVSTWPEGLRHISMPGRSRASLETGYFARPDNLVRHRLLEEGEAVAAASLLPDETALRGASGLLLAAAAQINRETRLLQRLADFGIPAREAPPLAHAVVELEFTDPDEGEDPPDRQFDTSAVRTFFDTGAAALEARLANAEEAALLSSAAIALKAGLPLCTVTPAFEANVWTFRRENGVTQLVHATCRVGTGQEPEGYLALIETAHGESWSHLLATAPHYPLLPDGDIDWDNIADSGGPVPVAAHQALRIGRVSDELLAIAGVDGRAALLDMRAMLVRHSLTGLTAPEQIDIMALTLDGQHLLQANTDGRWFLRRLSDGMQTLAGVHLDDEVVAFDAALNFDATPEAARFVQLRFPGDRRLYTLDQIGARAQTAGLASRALQAGEPLPPPALRALPPRIEAVEADAAGGVWLGARTDGGAGEVRVFRDGVELSRLPFGAETGRLHMPLPALPETRGFALQLRDAQGLTSAPYLIPRTPVPDTRPEGVLHVLAVGTDIYDDPAISDLGFAVFDAEGFASATAVAASGENAGAYYREVQTDILTNSRDLRGDLLARIADLAERVAPQDTVFLHVAGHGFTDTNGALRLADGATRLDRLEETSLVFDDLAVALAAVRGRVVVFLDACHSGAAGAGTNDDAVAALLANGAPVAVIAASKGRQQSLESARLGGGAFTAALIRALHDDSTDLDGNGVLDLSEIYATIKRDVVTATAGQQTPWIARSAFVGPVPLF